MKPPFLLAKAENSTGAPRSPKPEGKGQCEAVKKKKKNKFHRMNQ